MHTYKAQNTTFVHDSDLSGDVIIRRGNNEIEVPGEDLLSFVAEYVRSERVGALESASHREILGLEQK